MSEEQLKAFLEKVKGDTSLQEKLKAPVSPEATIDIAKAERFAITAEDIQSMPSTPIDFLEKDLEGAATVKRLGGVQQAVGGVQGARGSTASAVIKGNLRHKFPA